MSTYDACPGCSHPCSATDRYCAECGYPLDGDATMADPLVGKLLPGGYRITEFIAEGSMGRVYRGEQSTLGRNVAIKIMNAALLSHPKMIDRFRTEARAASMLNHPNCMRVFDFGETTDRRPYLVMELLQGQDLELLLGEEPLQPISRVLDITLQVLRALEEAHGQGIVHRDLKPGNVFMLPQRGGGDLVKVVDFGLAKLRSAISNSTMTGIVCGTPAYMSPEQASASETDGRTDVYACGVMLFEMVCGRTPFIGDDPHELLKAQVYETPPQITDVTPDRAIPGLQSVLDRALAKAPEDRFVSAAAFAEAISELVAQRTGERSRSWVRTAQKACSECGGLMPAVARFCGECGAAAPRDSLHSLVPRSEATTNAPKEIRAMAAAVGRAQEAAHALETRPPESPRHSSVLPRTMPPPPLDNPEAASKTISAPAPLHEEIDAEALFDDEPEDANLALMFLEQRATDFSRDGRHDFAVVMLRRAVARVREDMDRGEIDDPIAAMALFASKLGESLLALGPSAKGSAREALMHLREAFALSSTAADRVRLLLSMARAARELGATEEASRYLEEAEFEAETRSRTSHVKLREPEDKRKTGG